MGDPTLWKPQRDESSTIICPDGRREDFRRQVPPYAVRSWPSRQVRDIIRDGPRISHKD